MNKAILKQPFSSKRVPLITLLPLITPLTLYIDPAGKCNFKCKFCFQGDPTLESKLITNIMSFELFTKICNDLKTFDNNVKKIHLHGFGEPLLNKNISKMVQTIKNGLAEVVAITTNGSALNKEMAEKLVAAGLDEIYISIYGLSDEDYLNLTQTKTNVKKLFDNVKNLFDISRGSQLRIHCKLIGSYFSEEQRENFKKTYSGISDSIWIDNASNIWPGLDIADSLPLNTKIMHQYSIESAQDDAGKICPQPFYQMLVHSNGKVSPCCADFSAEASIGDVNEASLKEIWEGKIRKAFIEDQVKGDRKKHSACSKCDYPKNGSSIDLGPHQDQLNKIYL
jgi:radical SAM protein with 4Fe4S-binding SPASM domain